jgi:hypothetical protein
VAWWNGREVALSGHAAVETYSVLTRLAGDLRLEPADAARLLAERFAPSLLLAQKTTRRLADTLARLDISGGAVCDALVALAAVESSPPATPARPTRRSAHGSSSRPDRTLAALNRQWGDRGGAAVVADSNGEDHSEDSWCAGFEGMPTPRSCGL